MIIHPCTPKRANGEIELSARIELERPPYRLPSTLWFRFPETQADFLNDHADGFAIALLNLALTRGENITVRGTLSPRLAFGIQEFQRVQSLWHSREHKPIEIYADHYAHAESSDPRVACAFSGGVDSFFTAWSHLRQNERFPGDAISYGVFVHGFDIGLHDTQTYQTCCAAYADMLHTWNIELLTASTNVRRFDEVGDWVKASDAALVGLAHLLSRRFRRFYVPSSDYYGDFPTWRADSLLDALLSSESLEVITDGARFPRFEKIAALTRVPETYNLLRVCYTKPDGLMNCCECDNCISTMMALELCSALPKYKTFPLPLTRRKILFTRVPHAMLAIQLGILRGAWARERYDVALEIAFKLFLNSFRWGTHMLQKRLGC